LAILPRILHYSQTLAVGLAILFGGGVAVAGPQTGEGAAASASSPASAAQPPSPKGDFFSSVKQAFKQDLDHDVVRGHFDVGTPPDTHRYYCLVDAKTGKSEANGVGGEPVLRPDGMTGIKSGAVSFYSCVNAEQQGILVTTGYSLSPAIRNKVASAPPPPPPPAQRETKAPDVGPVAAPVAASVQPEILAVYARFIAGQNAHDRAAVSDVLLDSKEFVWAQIGGTSLWGHKEAMDAFQDQWKGTWTLDPQLKEARIANVAPNVAVLIAPLLFTQGAPGEKPSTVPIRWSGVFVRTATGWRISSIFITPFASWHALSGP
jgi:hypothetical protein